MSPDAALSAGANRDPDGANLAMMGVSEDQAEPMSINAVPDRSEAAEYYFTYIDKVPPGDICDTLEAQLGDTFTVLNAIGDEASLQRYAPDKWTIRQVLSHLNDTERLFTFRAMWFARGFDSPLPSFDQDVAIREAAADERPWRSHIEEFRSIRMASLALFRHLPRGAWSRRGIASDNPFSVRALAYITAGHVAHHVGILQSRYGV